MKKFRTIASLLSSFLLMSFSPSVKGINKAAKTFDGRGYNTKIVMDFTNSTEEEINDYYGNIGEKVGDSLKDYLYTRISTHKITSSSDSENLKYYQTYSSGVTKWYKITDRNWELSRPITPETYLFDEDTYTADGTNYYETMLYFKDTTTPAKQITTDVNGFTGVTSSTSIDWKNKTCPKASGEYGNNKVQVDKEHVWVKSHGFSPSGDPAKGAGTDLHHLIAADHNTNNVHNDKYYGTVSDHNASSTKTVFCLYGDGTYNISGWVGLTDEGEECFEPTDQWKGNIARALFYMATRYSDKLATNTEYEPYLEITKGNNGIDDNTNYHGVFHNLEDFLTWNDLDPIDEYEIKRNNLIYKNVQDNRNPYIDHPEWVRRVFDDTFVLNDSSSTNSSAVPTSSFTPSSSTTEPSKTSTSTTPSNPFSLFGLDTKTTYLVLIIAAVVLFIILILIFVFLNKGKRKKLKSATKKAYKTYKKKNKKK